MLLNRVKTLLGITDNDELIYEIVEITKSKILNYINKEELPKELEFILIEMAVSRFNKSFIFSNISISLPLKKGKGFSPLP